MDTLEAAVASRADAILLMNVRIQDLSSQRYREARRKKPILIHADLVRGLSSDREAIDFIREAADPTAIVSTRGGVLRSAQRAGMATVQRVFLIDSQSMQRTIGSVVDNSPDAVEIMPGIAPSIVPLFRREIRQPIILGGLITTEDAIAEAFRAGADAVSLSKAAHWDIRPDRFLAGR